LTGDRTLLEEMFPYAEKNLAAHEPSLTDAGLRDDNLPGWVFVDWGHVRNEGPSDMVVNLHYLASVRGMVRWCRELDKKEPLAKYEALDKRMTAILARWLDEQLKAGPEGWEKVGYHSAVLGLKLDFYQGQRERDAVSFIKKHMLRCFPNNPDAPRQADPYLSESQILTPYFAHYALPLLIERGEADFALDQMRKCWGWALEDGRTTWVEVFDTRWTHCHQWAGCPTWQLSRYGLGLWPRFDLGKNHFAFRFEPGNLKQASGSIPLPDGMGSVEIQWHRAENGKPSAETGELIYEIKTPAPLWLHPHTNDPSHAIRVEGGQALKLKKTGATWSIAP
jgi:hypothetical protein